jgi:iron(III) transport system substrate-binding protein
MSRKSLSLLAALVGLALASGACSGGRDALTIYSGREESLVGPLLERFAEETDINIDVRYGDSADLALLIAEEGDDTPADVFFSQSPGTVGFLNDRGMLESLDEAVIDAVPAQYRSDDGHWVGVTARQRVLVYNTEQVDESDLPRSVFELTSGQYAGEVGLAPTNASFQDFVTAMRQFVGEERTRGWLEEMAGDGNPTYPDNISIVDAVSRGEIPIGLVNHYYNYQFLAEEPESPTRNYQFPGEDLGSLLLASTASVLAPSDDQERAARFVELLLSEEAQEFFSEETFEYPLASGVEPSEDLPSLQTLDVPDFDIDRLGGGLRETVELIAESGLL